MKSKNKLLSFNQTNQIYNNNNNNNNNNNKNYNNIKISSKKNN